MVTEDEDMPNWIMDDTSVLSHKIVKRFFSYGMECLDWGNLI